MALHAGTAVTCLSRALPSVIKSQHWIAQKLTKKNWRFLPGDVLREVEAGLKAAMDLD